MRLKNTLDKLNLLDEPSPFQNREARMQKQHNWDVLRKWGNQFNDAFGDTLKSLNETINNQINRLDNMISNSTNDDLSELVDTRTPEGSSNTYLTLNKRLTADFGARPLKEEAFLNVDIKNDYKALVASFMGENGMNLDLYATKDYINFIPINKSKIINDNLRDPSVMFRDGTFYFVYTSNPVMIIKTVDLINFETVETNISIAHWNVWGPQWFTDDNGDTYLFITIGDVDDGTINDGTQMKVYSFKMLDDSFEKWSQPKLINMQDADGLPVAASFIDAAVYRFKDKKIMTVRYAKDDVRKIQIYESNDVSSFKHIADVPFNIDKLEGPSLIYDDEEGRYYCYADAYGRFESFRMESYDLINWVNEIKVGSTDKSRTEHFDIINLTDDMKRSLQKALLHYLPENVALKKTTKLNHNPYIRLNNGNNVITPTDGAIYYVGGSDQAVITEVMLDNVWHETSFYLISNSPAASIKVQSTANVILPNGFELWINEPHRIYEFLSFGTLPEGHLPETFRLKTAPSGFLTKRVWLNNTMGTGGVHGQQYESDKMINVTIDVKDFSVSKAGIICNCKDLGVLAPRFPVTLWLTTVSFFANNHRITIRPNGDIVTYGDSFTDFKDYSGSVSYSVFKGNES